MLTFIQDTRSDSGKKALYKCDCGNFLEAFTNNVNRGHTKSCGCLQRATRKVMSTTHGHKSNGKRSKVYVAWVNMKGRCNNANRKDSKNYIDRGITYCIEWESFENFLRDMGEPSKNMTLDRKDNSLGYSKENCRWVSMQVQGVNKRNNVRYELDGKNLTLSEWSEENGIGRITMLKRIQRGVPLNLALTCKGFLRMPRATDRKPESPTNDLTTGLIRLS